MKKFVRSKRGSVASGDTASVASYVEQSGEVLKKEVHATLRRMSRVCF